MSGVTAAELGRILLRRREVLGAVVEGTGDKRALVDELDIPRSTLDDVMRELAEAGLVEYADGEWVPTVAGRCAATVHEEYVDRIAGLVDAAGVLEAAPEPDIDPAVLDGCTVLEAGGALPDWNVTAFTERVREADEFRGLVPQALAGHVPSVYEAMVGDSPVTTELIFDPAVYAELAELYDERTREALDAAHISLYRAPLSVDYGLWVADAEHVGVIVYDNGGARGIIVNETDPAVDWALERYREVRDRADPVTPGAD